MDDYINCFACKSKCLNIEGSCHEYMLSSPGCWEMFCEVIEKEYSDFRYTKAHHFTVDTYAVQHVGKSDDKRAIRSVNIHLASLYAIFELRLNLADAANFKNEFSQYYKNSNKLEWLTPPEDLGKLTIYDLWNNENPHLHFQLAEKWAKSVWESWKHKHKRIAFLVEKVKKDY